MQAELQEVCGWQNVAMVMGWVHSRDPKEKLSTYGEAITKCWCLHRYPLSYVFSLHDITSLVLLLRPLSR